MTAEAEEAWLAQLDSSTGLFGNLDCTPGYYNFEGQFNRRQDGNYNGSFKRYYDHMANVREHMDENFTFTTPAAAPAG